MAINVYNHSIQISNHFNSKEIKCPHCGIMKIDTELINKIEKLFSKLNASKCIVSSGYRCPTYDKKENGFTGKHSEGLAIDCCFYDNDNKIIPSKIVICVAYDLNLFNGIAKIDNNYVHLDNRKNGLYRGDETKGNLSYWINPYSYFGVIAIDVAKYTGRVNATNVITDNIRYQSHGLNKKWYPNILKNSNDYAGVFGIAMDGVYIDELKYRVKVNGKWLPEVVGRVDYAGILGQPITTVSKYLGHASTKETLDTYAHMFPNNLTDVKNTMDNLNLSI